MATNVWATTTPVVVNGSVNPNQRSRCWPSNPRRPRAENKATPATTGGNTIDSVHKARTRPRPGNATRSSNHASGTPNTNAATVAHNEHHNDNRNAVSALSDVSV